MTYKQLTTHIMETTDDAFNLGFKDGLNTGEEKNPFEDGQLFRAYRNGYESGVNEYCRRKQI